MGRQIIKVSREDDLYMEWSSVVEAPTFFGDRAETTEHLSRQACACGCSCCGPTDVEVRLTRADETGSSGIAPFDCPWDADGEIYQQQGVLPRSAFGEFAQRWLAAEGDAEPDVADLLEPFEDPDEDPAGLSYGAVNEP